jgi:CDGSH-type Zn-finger protein
MVKSLDPYAIATKAPGQYIVSNLNPKMFRSYHGGNRVDVEMLRTWICPGYTGNRKPICDHPYDKVNSP